MTEKVPLTIACGLYDRMSDLFRGDVQPDGIRLNFIPMDGSAGAREIFDRMGGKLELDASEMSSSEFISRFGTGHCPFVAIPVFASRLFRHGFIFFNRKAGIRTPKDLEGKRVGVPLYTMSAAIWIRGLLQHEYGFRKSAGYRARSSGRARTAARPWRRCSSNPTSRSIARATLSARSWPRAKSMP